MLHSDRIKTLSQKEVSELVKGQRKLIDLQNYDPFLAFNPNSGTINNFSYFSQTIKKSLKAYETLAMVVDNIENSLYDATGSDIGLEGEPNIDPDSQEYLLFQLLKERNKLHLTTYEIIKFKVKSVFNLVEQYLDQVTSDEYQSTAMSLLAINLQNLQSLLTSPKQQSSKVGLVQDEFEHIRDILNKELKFKREDILNIASSGEGEHRDYLEPIGEESDGSEFQEPVELPLAIKMQESPKGKLIDVPGTVIKEVEEEQKVESPPEVDRIRIKIETGQLTANFSPEARNNSTFISFTGRNSFLSTLHGFGLTVKKEGQLIYQNKFYDELKNLKEVVNCKGVYYLYNYHPQGRILRKIEDASDPVIWWDKQNISGFEYYNKNVRAALNETALVVNLNQTDLIVIEIQLYGTPGRELVIKNNTGSRINCHEPLLDNKILTITKKGLMMVYGVDMVNYSAYEELDKLQVELDASRVEDHFFLTVCERSEYCGLLLENYSTNLKASRIRIYKLKGPSGESRLSYMTQLDLWADNWLYYPSICFSQYLEDVLILCGQSSKGSMIHVYSYDISKNELVEKVSETLGGSRICYKLARNGPDEVNGVLWGGEILRFKVSLEK